MIGLLAGAAVYTLAGFLIAPLAIKHWIESPNVSGPDCRLRVQEVYVNPFTMFLSLRNVTLFEQENKLLVSANVTDTEVWSIDRFRAGKPGRDVAIRSLVITSAETGQPMLAVPTATATGVTLGAPGALIEATHVSLERPDVALTHDTASNHFLLTWVSAAGNGRGRACISLDGLRAVGGQVRLRDDAVSPSVQLELRDVVAGAHRKTGGRAAVTEISVDARVGESGSIGMEARLRSETGRHPDSFLMQVDDVDLEPLSPYFRRKFGRDIVAGSGSGTLRQERNDVTLRIDNDLVFAGLRLGDPDTETVDDTLPLELALALVTDQAGRGGLSVQYSLSESQTQTVAGVFIDSLAAHLDELAARPFVVLAELAGDDDAVLDEITFLSGSAETAPAATDTLTLLALALELRPRLGIRVRPAYDPAADRDAIAAQQVRLHIALATSAGRRDRDEPTGPNFNDPRVRDVIDEFAGTRLSEAQRRAIARDASDETTTYRDTYLALVANERVSETVLRRLARFRARSVIDALEREGIDRKRFRIADALDTVTTDAGTVPLRFEIQVRLPSHDG